MTLDYNEVILIVIGAGIGFVGSCLTMLTQSWMNKRGKLNIFYRFIYQKFSDGTGWGFGVSSDGKKSFTVPVVFEFQNTSNTTRVIRDVSLLLYNGDKCIGKMKQLEYIHNTQRNIIQGRMELKETEYYFGTEKGSYSFVLEPRSIQRQKCEYAYKINESEIDENRFDRIKACYYDEKNKAKYFDVKEINGNWETKHYKADEDWILLK